MEPVYALFLEAMKAALENRPVTWGTDVPPEDVLTVLDVAQEHHVLPMIFEAIYACPAAAVVDGVVLTKYRRGTVQAVMNQALKTEDFLALNRHLRENGVTPLVVKGIICRSLYPKPDYRLSGDEDVLCGEHQFNACHKAMISFGMEPCGSSLESYEVPYRKEDSPLFIELHKSLFVRDSDVFSGCNRFFDDAFSRAVEIVIDGTPVATLSYTDHMLYLIIHAFKHFLHCGFGIRQVCDMILFANTYGQNVDWAYVLTQCRSIRAEKFAASLFRIGQKYLGFSPESAHYPTIWQEIAVDEHALLEDLLHGGIYGASDRSRIHSSNMTLNAVEADMKGKKSRGNLLRTVFPTAKSIEGRYPYLRRKPFLLPAAWICRIFGYVKETISEPSSAAADVIRTGSKRIELLREYNIID